MQNNPNKRSQSVSPLPALRKISRSQKLATINEVKSIQLRPKINMANIRYPTPSKTNQDLGLTKTEGFNTSLDSCYFPKERLFKSEKIGEIKIRDGNYHLSSPKAEVSPYRTERVKVSLPLIQSYERISYFTDFLKNLKNRKSSAMGRLRKLAEGSEVSSQSNVAEDSLNIESKAQLFSFIQGCKVGNLKKVKKLLGQNPDLIHASDSIFMTGLHWAALREKPHIVEYLIKCHSNVNAVDISNRTPLFLAAKFDSTLSIRILLSHGANPLIASHSNKTPISISKSDKIAKMIKLSLQGNLNYESARSTVRDETYTKAFFTHKSETDSEYEI